MNSSAIATGRSPPRWPLRSWCCWSGPSPFTSTTTPSSSRHRHGEPHLALPRVHPLHRNRGAVHPDPGLDRLFLQRVGTGERVGRLLDQLVLGTPPQRP